MHPLLVLDDDEFEETINSMDAQSVLESVAGLQEQMVGEQEQFDELSARLAKLAPSAPDYSDLRGELTTLQDRLALLLDRNMRCLQVANEAEAEQKALKDRTESIENGNSVLDFETLERNLVPDRVSIIEDPDEPNEGEPEDLIPAWKRITPKPIPSQKPKLKSQVDSPKKVRFSFDEEDEGGNHGLDKKDKEKEEDNKIGHVNGTSLGVGINGNVSSLDKKEVVVLSMSNSGVGESNTDTVISCDSLPNKPVDNNNAYSSLTTFNDNEKVLPWKKKFAWSPLKNKSISLDSTNSNFKPPLSEIGEQKSVGYEADSVQKETVQSVNKIRDNTKSVQVKNTVTSSENAVHYTKGSQVHGNRLDKPQKPFKPVVTSSVSSSITRSTSVSSSIASSSGTASVPSSVSVDNIKALNKSSTKPDGMSSEEHERINFSAARSMFEGGTGGPTRGTSRPKANFDIQKRPRTTNGSTPAPVKPSTNGVSTNGVSSNNVQKASVTFKLNTTTSVKNSSVKPPPPVNAVTQRTTSQNSSAPNTNSVPVKSVSVTPRVPSESASNRPDKPKVVSIETSNSHTVCTSQSLSAVKLNGHSGVNRQSKTVSSATYPGGTETVNGGHDSRSGSSAGDRTPSPAAVAATSITQKRASPISVSNLTDTGAAGAGGDSVEIDEINGDEKVKDRVTLQGWDPEKLLRELYKLDLQPDVEASCQYVNMEGYMEKLPANKKKATLLKTWKRRFFKTQDGSLHYYENGGDHASGSLQLMGGHIEELGGQMLGVDDGKGHYLVLRCPSDEEYNSWLRSLQSQTIDNMASKYMKAQLLAPPHPNKKVVVFDLGSCSIRAGILGDKPTLPQLFFPTVVAEDSRDGSFVCGFEACKPMTRHHSTIHYPVRPSIKVDKFSLDIDMMPHIIQKVFNELKVDPTKYWVLFSAPANLSDKFKIDFVDLFLHKFGVIGINIVNQTLLALYSYNTSSGIVVDVGERLEILPVTDGYIAEGGVSRQPYGGRKVTESLNASLTEKRYHFFTDVEFCIARLAMEKLCYVADNFNEESKRMTQDLESFQRTLSLTPYDLPAGSWTEVIADGARFSSPEGIFNLDEWGMDNPSLQKLVQRAVTACPMDTRREMWRSVYLAGGLTMMPGFADRLQKELQKISPQSIVVQVHASPQRYHAAYIGGCVLAGMSAFERSCITPAEWKKDGVGALRKWQMY